MSIVAGIARNGRVYMGCDSAASTDVLIQTRPQISQGKVFTLEAEGGEPLLIGMCGSKRVAQLVKYTIHLPPIRGNGLYYLFDEFVPRLRDIDNDHVDEISNYDIIVGFNGSLFEIMSDYQVAEFDDNYTAIGGGGLYGLGAMRVAVENESSPEDVLKAAVDAACHFSPTCRKPFYMMYI